MNYKQVLIFAIMLSILSAFAAADLSVSLITPASGGTMTGSYLLNASYGGLSGEANCTFQATSALVNGSTAIVLGTNISAATANASLADGYATLVYNTVNLHDSSDWQVTAACINTSLPDTDFTHATNTGVIVDNTVASAPSATTPADGTVSTDGTQTFTATVNSDTTTFCTLVFPAENPGQGTYPMVMTPSGVPGSVGTCSVALTAMPEMLYHGWYVVASDGKDTANSAATPTFESNLPGSSAAKILVLENAGIDTGFGIAKQKKEVAAAQQNQNTALIVVALVVVGLILYNRRKRR